jgi:hypothetical protein
VTWLVLAEKKGTRVSALRITPDPAKGQKLKRKPNWLLSDATAAAP